jgi:hypothetical protein
MAKMSNRKKESIAVSAIAHETYKEGSYLVAEIPVGDKAPSFDGHITVFKDDSEKKESYLNDVPTQVKGTGVSEFSKFNRKFPLDIVHYNNYYKRGGCLLLVVEIKENLETKIFYKQLLPTELNQIIKGWGHQKKYSVELRPLDETSLYIVCKRFIDQMIKQPIVLIQNNKYKEEEYENLIFTSLTYNPNKGGVKDIFNHDFIQFGIKNNIEYPIRNMRIAELEVADVADIYIKGNHYKLKVQTKYSNQGIVLKVEDCLEFNVHEKNSKMNFKLSGIYSLKTQLQVLPLIIDFLKLGEIKIRDFVGKINKEPIVEKYIKDLNKTYSTFLDLKIVFDQLKVDYGEYLGNGEKLQHQIENLIDLMLNKNYKSFNISDSDNANFIKYVLGEICIILFYKPKSDTKVINAFSNEISKSKFTGVIDNSNKQVRFSPYVLLEKDTLIKTKNIDFKIMRDSFEPMILEANDHTFGLINNFCLTCIGVFDVTKNLEFLSISLFLLDSLRGKVSKSNEHIIEVNYYQILLRRNENLSKGELRDLVQLKVEVSKLPDSNTLIYCINVLLGNKLEADLLWEEIDETMKKTLEKLPIMTLYKSLK